ncbi:MAG: hypothetical protein ABIR11_07150 [Candidatus Limnocylindrales bacterium]
MASKTIGNVQGKLGKFDKIGRIGGNAIRSLTTNLVRLGAAGAVAIAGMVGAGVRSLAHLQRVEAQTNAVIESTGGAAGVTAAEVRALAQEIEGLTTADDKNVQEAENLLLTFTKIGKDTFPAATKAAVNMAIAMAKGDVANADFKGTALQVGKALNDPLKGLTALGRAGVSFTKQQTKQIKTLVESGDVLGAQKVILAELTKEFGKAGEAAASGPEGAWRRLQDAGEELSQALAKTLLPVLERAAKWLTTKLSDPAVIKGFEDLGREIGNAGDALLKFVDGIDWKSITNGVKGAAGIAGSIVGAFMGLPDWVKTAVVSGWGLNKLTGGALGSVIGELGKGLIKGVMGMNAGVVNINAGVVKGGGLPGGAGGAAGGVGAATLLGAAAITAAAVAAVGVVAWDQNNKSTNFSAEIRAGLDSSMAGKSIPELRTALAGVNQGITSLQSNPLNVLVQGDALKNLQAMKADIAAQLGKLDAIKRNSSGSPDDRQEQTLGRNKSGSPDMRDDRDRTTAREIEKTTVAVRAVREGVKTSIAAAAVKAQAEAFAVRDTLTAKLTATAQTGQAAAFQVRDRVSTTATVLGGQIGLGATRQVSATANGSSSIVGAISRIPAPITTVNVYVTGAAIQAQTTRDTRNGGGNASRQQNHPDPF